MRGLSAAVEKPIILAGATAFSVATALALVQVGPVAAVALALLPLLAIGLVYVITTGQTVIYAAAIALPMIPIPGVGRQLGGLLYPQDLIALTAFAAIIFAKLMGRGRVPPLPTTPIFGWPFVFFASAIATATLRGHYAYGASLIGQPLRLILYAAVISGLIGMTVPRLHRLLTAWFYGGATMVALAALYYAATGGSQTDQIGLSTGGTRLIAISTSLYCAGALFLALLNMRLASGSRERVLHLTFAALALFGVAVAFGRAAYLGVFVVGAITFLASPRLRRNTLSVVPLALPFAALLAIGVSQAAPELVHSLGERVSGYSASDPNVQWRVEANRAVFQQIREQPVFGVGFGRTTEFFIEAVDSRTGIPYEQSQEIEQDPHNGYAYLLAGGGIVALGSFLLILSVFAVDAVRRYRRTTDETARLLILWTCATLFVFLVNAGSGTSFESPVNILTIWALLVLPAIVRPTDGTETAARG